MTDIGAVLGGRYRLIELLGQGGMATIYRGRDTQLERDVAVKVLLPEYGRDPDFFARFRHEAQSAASLNHPGVVAVYDYGTDPVGPYIVMELVDGEDLSTIIRRTGALSPRQAARIVSQAARAIEAAHDRGFVHRDIKPGNILVTRDGRVKVADFGIARALAESALTMPGTTLGSVHYFSPEQARGELATPASDIYSLGIVLYELLTGRRPWMGDTAAAIATARLSGMVPSPAAVRPGVPDEAEAITRRALALRPEERYGSAAELADDLDAYLAGERVVAGTEAARDATPVGAGLAGAALAGAGYGAVDSSPTIAAGIARPNPDARMAYPGAGRAPGYDDVAGGRLGGARRPAELDLDEEGPEGRSAWVWLSAAIALVVLALAIFLVFRLVSGPGTAPVAQVAVPSFIGMTFAEAQTAAERVGLKAIQYQIAPSTDAEPGTVIAQDPEVGEEVDEGSEVRLTLAEAGQEDAIVPDLRGKPESEALNRIAQAQLQIGARTEAFDEFIPQGSVISQDPGPGVSVVKGTVVNYVVSKGPQPTPSPTVPPTPPPTAAPTTPPTPAPTCTVPNVIGLPLAAARATIEAANCSVGTIVPDGYAESWIVCEQSPLPGTTGPKDMAVDLKVAETSCP